MTNRSFRVPVRASIPLLVLLAATAVSSGCANPKAQAAIAQELNDAANEIDGLKSDMADLQSDMDSLKTVVARQDSTINRIVAGMPK